MNMRQSFKGIKGKLSVAVALAVIMLSMGTTTHAQESLLLNGAGATFPYPIYSKWFDMYSKVDRTVRFNYQSIGSGGGIRQILAGTVDFGATDGPMSDEQIKEAKIKILHFPTVMGAVVPTYNIPGISGDLNFTAKVLADIFLGKIRKWNDPAIANANPGIALPNQDIIVVHRSDGSGTTYVWVDYLSKVSAEWKEKVGKNTSVNWPVGLGGKGNEGVAGLVKQTPGSLGYVELIYAEQNKLPYGKVQNREGAFVKADLKSVTAAAAGTGNAMPKDFRVSITDAPGKAAYPVSSFTWLLIPEKIGDPQKGKALVHFLDWMLAQGQMEAPKLMYAPLPETVLTMEKDAIKTIRY